MSKPNEVIHPELAQQSPAEAACRPPITEVVKTGKVRDVHAFRGLVFVTSDRLSVFDRVILENVPLKGSMLNCISQYNKRRLSELGFKTDHIPVPNAFFGAIGFKDEDLGRLSYEEELTMIPVEFIVRGYLVGNAYKAYSKGEPYCGFTFPDGMKNGDKLSAPIVTPTTKEENGHDQPLTKEECIKRVATWLLEIGMTDDADTLYDMYTDDYDAYLCERGDDLSDEAKAFGQSIEGDEWDRAANAQAYEAAEVYVEKVYESSMKIFTILSEMCAKNRIMFIDSKFEYGIDKDGEIVLADEVGTPDSSRFAPADVYANTGEILSMDKQIARDFCASVGFTGDKDQPTPELPQELITKLSDNYVALARAHCGEEFVAQYLINS